MQAPSAPEQYYSYQQPSRPYQPYQPPYYNEHRIDVPFEAEPKPKSMGKTMGGIEGPVPSTPPPNNASNQPNIFRQQSKWGIFPSSHFFSRAPAEPSSAREEGFTSSAISNNQLRKDFIVKVYSILAVQLAITLGLSCLAVFHTPTRHFFVNHGNAFIWGTFIPLIVTVVSYDQSSMYWLRGK